MRDPLMAEAHEILTTAQQGGDQRELAWAAGTVLCYNAIHIMGYWRSTDGAGALSPASYGQSLDRGRWIWATPKHIELTGGNLERALIVRWSEVAALLDTVRVEHFEPCRAAVKARGVFLRSHDDFLTHPGRDAIEDRCQAVGLAAWAACRPTTHQLDLFDLFNA